MRLIIFKEEMEAIINLCIIRKRYLFLVHIPYNNIDITIKD